MIQASVIIPAYNAAQYIEATIASAMQQDQCDLEIIVVDDRSTDNTAAIVAEISRGDSRVSLLALPRNGGPSVARNAGIAAARGEWIALLDADDSFAPTRLATLIALGETKQADMVADNLLLVDAVDGSRTPMLAPGSLTAPCMIDLPEFIARNISSPDAPRTNYGFLKPLMRRDFLMQHGLRYDETVRFAEDFALYVACLRAGARWWLHPDPLYRYLVRPDSLTQIQTTGDLDALRRRQRALLDEARANCDARLVALLRRHLRTVDRCYYYRGFTDEAKARRPRAALRYLFASPNSVLLVTQESARQLPLILRKALRGGYKTVAR
ncbi:glycosyltransferase family 2 protein [Sphingomonas faeni]|uniref:glycosyltransferase family 2 protein n=1 Tax=Sphingomonas faeni TaxID=185950 RepID=UPI0020BF4F7D|nr:glycosyltransferase family 2 protein [Sphingomonas faeni]MCK8456752.1 glycosyltransferase family 2 protein [Sphingomonas faeni]